MPQLPTAELLQPGPEECKESR